MTITTIKAKYPTGNIYKVEHNSDMDTQFKVFKNDELIGYISFTEMVNSITIHDKLYHQKA